MKSLRIHAPLLVLMLLLATPAWAQLGFGGAVAVGDHEVFVGEAGNRADPGFVYVYRPGPDGWKEQLQLVASDGLPGDGFGAAIAVGDELLLVGATGTTNGAVYVFERDGDTWREIGQLAATDGSEGDRFGTSISFDSERVLVGASSTEGGGAAYLFRWQAGAWTQEARLVRPAPEPDPEGEEEGPAAGADAAAEEAEGEEEAGEAEEEEEEPAARRFPPRFGAAVALYGEWAVVGAPFEERAGSVHLYRLGDDGWAHVGRLPGQQGERGSSFGSTVGFRGDELFVGAPGANGGVGAVHVYGWDEEAQEWDRSGSLMPFDGGRGDSFGSTIAFDGGDVLVGAPGASRIYRFGRDEEGRWTDSTKVGTDALERRDRFAGSLAAADGLIAAGMPGDDYGAGTAVIMARTDWGWERTKVLSDIRNFDPVTGGMVECTDGTAASWECENVDLMSFLPVHEMGGGRGVRANDIWGWTDPQTGKQYALVGMTDQAAFVDVTDPIRPVYVGRLPKPESARGSSWRDIKVHRDHAFIVSDSARDHGMQVFDLTRLRQFDGEPITFDADAHYDGFRSSHNIVINEDSGFAYAVGASGGDRTCGGGLHMINIEDPTRPVFAGCFADPSTGRRGTGYSHDAQCVIYRGPDESYRGKEICLGANETALSIADVTDKRNPTAVAMATYPNVGYTHQGWLSDDHRYFFMNDELDEIRGLVDGTRTLIWDVAELDDPILVAEYASENRASDHNLYVLGSEVYQSNYVSGLRVLDVEDPENPRLTAFFDTVPYGENEPGFSGSWSNYPYFGDRIVVVTSGNEGLFVVKVRE